LDELSELFAVTVHEAGHVFGLDHSNDAQSPMHTHGVPAFVVPTAADLALLRQNYGARSPDFYDLAGAGSNPIEVRPFEINDNAERGTAPTVVFGDVWNADDHDVYFVNLDDLDGGDFANKLERLRFQVITSRLSQLAPSLEVRRVIDESPWTSAPIPTISPAESGAGEDVEITVPKNQVTGLVRDDILEIRVTAATTGEFSTGGYTLVIWYDGITDPTITADPQIVDAFARFPIRILESDDLEDFFEDGFELLVNKDLGLNDLPGMETQLDTTPGFVDGTRYELYASIEIPGDVDRYRISAPVDLTAGQWGTITLRSTSMDFASSLTIWDPGGTIIPAEVLVHNDETLVVQYGPLTADANYIVQVEADVTATTPASVGSYEMLALLGSAKIGRTPLAMGTLDTPAAVHQYTIHTRRPQLFQFVLAADAAALGNATIRMEIFNSAGDSVALLESTTGDVRSLAVLLPQGRFRLKVSISQGLGPVSYVLKGAAIDNPLGPRIDDGTTPYTFIRIRGAIIPLVAFAQ
jgi:hypothetical protein